MLDNASEILEFSRVLEVIATSATSEPGAERVKSLRPKTDLELVLMELNRVDEMVDLIEKGDLIPFTGIHDLTRPLNTASVAGAVLNPEILNKIASTAASARLIKKFLLDRAGIAGLLADMASVMTTFEELENAVRHAIDEVNEVRDTASPELRRIRNSIASERSNARAALSRILRSWGGSGFLQEDVIASRDGRLTLPVKGNARGRVKGLLVDQSSSGSTVFIEPLETVEINNNIRRLELEERREVERILKEITAIVFKYRFELEDTYNILLELDTLFARAEYAGRFDCTKPLINAENRIRIIDGRHPLLLIKEKDVVPLNLDLEEGIRTLVISGPNAGGKTVALKTVGTLTLMAMSGCFVPARKGTMLPLALEVHAVIGDDQSIAADLSTFSSHLTKLTKVVASSEKRKMVLIDEIMTGTDPAEGTALAISLLGKLTSDGALTLCTTHKGDLKAYAHKAEGVINGSLEFDPGSLSPTYRFMVGIPGSSYAFSLAKKVGLPAEIIERAEELRGEDRGALESLLLELTERMTEIDRLKVSASFAEARAEALRNQLEDDLKNAKAIEKKLVEKAEAEAEKVLSDANRIVEQAVKQIRDKGGDKDSVKGARELIAESKQKFNRRTKSKKHEKVKIDQGPVEIGDRVRLEDSETVGIVREGKNSKGRMLVECGGIKIWLDEAKLIKLQPAGKKDRSKQVKVKYDLSSEKVTPTLDIRGLDSQQAVVTVEEYLVQASTASFERVDIIHGKGTGVLRKVVSDILTGNPAVKSFKPGEWGQGDYGVTIVEMKL